MPVHLGSMSESIKTVMKRNAGQMQPGDVYVLNDPYHGGTHLPDITVVTPVWSGEPPPAGVPSGAPQGGAALAPERPSARAAADDQAILFYVASRGHHADVGGVTPGSMPPFSHAHRGGRRADRQRQARRAPGACAKPRWSRY